MDGKNRLLPRRGCVFHGQHLRWIVCNSGFCRGVIHQRDLHSSMDCLDCCYGERHCIGDMPHISERNSGCSNNQAISCGDSSIICSVLCQIGIDEASAYVGLPRPHEAVKHSAGEYVREMAHTNGLESHWALFKRGLDGIYYHVSVKHLGRYTTEFEGRHNNRPLDTEEQMGIMGAVGKRLTYEVLIGPKETRQSRTTSLARETRTSAGAMSSG